MLRISLASIADLALPRECLVCGRTLMAGERHLCMECLSDLPRTRFAAMDHNPMSDSYNAMLQRHLSHFEPYSHAHALFYYNSEAGYRHIPQTLKYGRNFAAGRHFAQMLGRELAASPLYSDVDAVIPVPLHWTRRWKRGYNQAETIAEEIARELGTKALCGMGNPLKRRRRTSTQTRLTVEEKSANVENAFEAAESGARHILLVDDVYTTGATLCACHEALRRAVSPETRISIATLAYVGSF